MSLTVGVRAWGITMTDNEKWKERGHQVARYQALEQETTDPLGTLLLLDIVSELEAELKELDGQGTATRDRVLKFGKIEFHGRAVSCVVRNRSQSGASLQVASRAFIPDSFTLALPLEGAALRCRLVWRRGTEIGVMFQ